MQPFGRHAGASGAAEAGSKLRTQLFENGIGGSLEIAERVILSNPSFDIDRVKELILITHSPRISIPRETVWQTRGI